MTFIIMSDPGVPPKNWSNVGLISEQILVRFLLMACEHYWYFLIQWEYSISESTTPVPLSNRPPNKDSLSFGSDAQVDV